LLFQQISLFIFGFFLTTLSLKGIDL